MVFGDTTPLARNYLVQDYRRDAEPEGVVRSVHIEAGFDRADPVAETAWLQALADPKGFPHALVAHAQLGAPDVERTLEAQSAFPSVRGIRHVVSWHKNPALTFLPRGDLMRDPDWRAAFLSSAATASPSIFFSFRASCRMRWPWHATSRTRRSSSTTPAARSTATRQASPPGGTA